MTRGRSSSSSSLQTEGRRGENDEAVSSEPGTGHSPVPGQPPRACGATVVMPDSWSAATRSLRRVLAAGAGVLAYHPATRQTHVVASGFYYADGVALSEDGSFLLVVETDALRVVKVWLAGGKAGQREVLVAALPGLPAGLSKASDGNFWVSMTVPVPPYSRYLGSVLLRALIAWSPRTWRPPVKVWGAVLKVSPEGRILQLLLDPTGARVATASAATEHNGRLFLGSIMGGVDELAAGFIYLLVNFIVTRMLAAHTRPCFAAAVHLFQCMLPVRSPDSAVFRACIVTWLSVASVVAHSAHTLVQCCRRCRRCRLSRCLLTPSRFCCNHCATLPGVAAHLAHLPTSPLLTWTMTLFSRLQTCPVHRLHHPVRVPQVLSSATLTCRWLSSTLQGAARSMLLLEMPPTGMQSVAGVCTSSGSCGTKTQLAG
ncbi:hypothetical protein COO60DRAFT_598507 [Scenedesmus sp. NREL 46B-D3]|nr:hypothetical protein COO60DRAFT_598507 [Scenedesmus sp. NREL 46B-D3]